MGRLKIFRTLTSVDGRLGFYTKETQHDIPETPGCYAWFLPLWFYSSDLDQLMQLVGRVLDYEQLAERHVEVPFNWHALQLRLRRATTVQPTQSLRTIWNRVLSDPTTRDALQDTLLEASLLMPPLYVGKTKNLRRRYLDHTTATARHKNDFHSRFTTWATELQLQLAVNDLLFVSLKTRPALNRALDDTTEEDLESLIEQMLMQFCRPAFSLK